MHGIQQHRQLRRGDVGPRQIEFVVRTIERAVPNHEQHQRVIGLGLPGDAFERRAQRRFGGRGTFERLHVGRAGGLPGLLGIAGPELEALLVIRFAAEARHG